LARALSEETVKKIQELIDKEIGDIERLHRILNSLQNGDPMESSDQQYIESLSQVTNNEKNENPISSDTFPLEPNNETNLNSIPESGEEIPKTPNGNRKKIALAGIVIAAILFSYIGANVYAVNTLQIKPHQGNQYAISETMLHIQAEACNPSYFPASFHNYEINAIYKSKVLETASINGSTISPKSSLLLDGTFTIDKEALSQFATLGSNFDPTQARVKTKLDAAIFGIIPFTINKDFSGKEFEDIVKNGPPGGYSC
jgi:hypothetical protein